MTKNATTAKGGALSAPSHPCRLSFVVANAPRGSGIDYWTVESTGSYTADCAKGRALGREYLAFIGQHPTNGNASLLQCIVGSMIDRALAQGRTAQGIEVGFLQCVNEYALAAAAVAYQPPAAPSVPLIGKAS